jgi:hypothetical protein
MNNSKVAYSVMFACTPFQVLPVYILFRAKNLWQSWVMNGPKHARYGVTKNGWFNEESFTDTFNTIFRVHWAEKLDGPKVMIGDNLASHFSIEVLQKCIELEIRFVTLPTNSTHLTQVLVRYTYCNQMHVLLDGRVTNQSPANPWHSMQNKEARLYPYHDLAHRKQFSQLDFEDGVVCVSEALLIV